MTDDSEVLDAWIRIETTPQPGAAALFVDRDGTIIENSPYLSDPAGVRLIPGAHETLCAFRASGYAVIMVTNQSGIARGLCSADQYREVEARVVERLGRAVDAIYACPFHPDGQGKFAREHPWRKPAAGMLLDAAERFRLDLGRSIMVGDSLCDIQAGARAGTRWLVHTLTGHGAAERPAVEAFAAGLEHSAGSSAVRYIPSIAALAPIGCDA